MSLSIRVYSLLNRIDTDIRYFITRHGEKVNIRKKKIIIKVTLTKAQKKEIDEYFLSNYGKRISYNHHRLYQSFTMQYQKKYFPEILFSTKLEPLLCNRSYASVLQDKNLLPVLFRNIKNIHIPKTYFSCINGFIQNGNNEPLENGNRLSELIANLECVIKKTVDTSSGRDVLICDFHNGIDTKTQKTCGEIIKEFGNNYVIQEKIKQSDCLNKLYPNAVNTFRIITYILDNEIFVCPVALRLGRKNADRDNIHYGGIGIGVNKDGRLKKQAFSEYGEEFYSHPDSGIQFVNYQIDRFSDLMKVAIELHKQVPWLGIISWDLTLDDNEVPTLIEMNLTSQASWFPQIVNGEALFGDNTGKMLKMISKQ